MSYYIQQTQEERYHISVLCKEGFSKAETDRLNLILYASSLLIVLICLMIFLDASVFENPSLHNTEI